MVKIEICCNVTLTHEQGTSQQQQNCLTVTAKPKKRYIKNLITA